MAVEVKFTCDRCGCKEIGNPDSSDRPANWKRKVDPRYVDLPNWESEIPKSTVFILDLCGSCITYLDQVLQSANDQWHRTIREAFKIRTDVDARTRERERLGNG